MGDQANVLVDRSKELNDQFYLLLNEVVKTYPMAKLYPESASQYDRTQKNDALYQANLRELHRLQNDYFVYKNQVVTASQNMLQTVADTDAKITTLENQNKVLSKQLNNLKTNSYSAEGLFDDTQITRNELLVSNLIFFGVICGGGFFFYKKIKGAG